MTKSLSESFKYDDGLTTSVQRILSDAKALTENLKYQQDYADVLTIKAKSVVESVDGIRHYQDELEDLNIVAKQRPRFYLVQGIQHEKRRIRELQLENQELQSALFDAQNAVEMVMSKYRAHISKWAKLTAMEQRHKAEPVVEQLEDLSREKEKQLEMVTVMKKAIELDEDFDDGKDELISKLTIENEGLRKLLHISSEFGSTTVARSPVTEGPSSTLATDNKEQQEATDEQAKS